MKSTEFSTQLPLSNVKITDSFWHRQQELVRKEVIPYQWDALNDRVEGADPSFCMRNFKVAGRLMREKREKMDLPSAGAVYCPFSFCLRQKESYAPHWHDGGECKPHYGEKSRRVYGRPYADRLEGYF